MRIAILSDIHGNAVALDACLADLRARGWADTVVAAGDLCMDGPRPAKVLRRLEEIGAVYVRGNTDRLIATEDYATLDDDDAATCAWQAEKIGPERVAWLGTLPFSLTFGDGASALLVCHANPQTDDEHLRPDADDATLERFFEGVEPRTIAFGHLHVPYTRTWRDRLLTCVASAGLPKDGDPRAHYAILTQVDGGWRVTSRRVAFDVDKVEKQLRRSDMPDAAERIKVLRRGRYAWLGDTLP